MESRPLKTIQIHDHLRGKLCDLYENDCIFDKFECTWSGDDKCVHRPILSIFPNRIPSRNVLTGSYHNYLRIFEVDTLNDVVLQADKSAFKAKKIGGPLPGNKQLGAKNGMKPGLKDAMQLEPLDFNKKILHASWHPRENTIAVRVLYGASTVATRADIRGICRSLLRTICSCTAPRDSFTQIPTHHFRHDQTSTTRLTLTIRPWNTMASAHFFGQCLPLSSRPPHPIPPARESYHQTLHSFAAIHRLSNPFIYSSYAPVVPPCSADADNHMHVALQTRRTTGKRREPE
jgi:hypothetical protein